MLCSSGSARGVPGACSARGMAAGARRIQNIILWCTLAHLSELVLLDVALTSAGANAGAGISDSEKMATSSMPCHWRGAPQHTAVGWALLAFDWLGRGSPVIAASSRLPAQALPLV